MDSDNSSATSLLRLGPSDFSSAPISYNYSSDKLSLFTQDSNYTQQITEFISKIKQKNDTLYVVALKVNLCPGRIKNRYKLVFEYKLSLLSQFKYFGV